MTLTRIARVATQTDAASKIFDKRFLVAEDIAGGSVASERRRGDALPPPPKEVLERALGITKISVEWLAGDGSDRCYYRLRSDELPAPLVLMQLSGSDAEALKLDGYDWVKIADILHDHKIAVPTYRIKLPDYAALIIDDYGDVMLESEILALSKDGEGKIVRKYYRECFELIGRLLQIPRDDAAVWCKRAFDFEKYSWELKFFFNQYVAPVAQLILNSAEQEAFIKECTALSHHLASFSHYFVHRDFHSRNIMVKDKKLALIDFQDSRLGPAAYDLASLVFDNYIPFELEFRLELVEEGLDIIGKATSGKVVKAAREHLKAVILQRQLKAIGTYGFLTHNKKRGDYLKYVPPALSTLTDKVVFDKRWPFLSQQLIHRLSENLA